MQLLATSLYHKVLRVTALVCALVLLFESGIISETTKVLSQNTHQYLANAVGVGASVKPNELNVITAELTQQKLALAEREQALTDREIAVGLVEQTGSTTDVSTYILAAILFILLVLIVLNYVLDYLHRTQENPVAA